ncbi:MAG TPA: hypothetical protein VD887_13575 [Allosphingosinicella sp.]|nr:hypothetical protein [Allosphingosinicella sp.]
MNLARSSPSYNEFGDEEIKDIVVRSYSIMGTVSGIGQSFAQIEAREAIIPDRNLADYSVRIELSSGGDYPQTSFANINYKDIDRFSSVLDKLTFTSITTDRFSFSEVQYEINDLSIIVFNTDRGTLMVAISHGGVTIHFTSVSKIADLRKLVLAAKDCLDLHKVN